MKTAMKKKLLAFTLLSIVSNGVLAADAKTAFPGFGTSSSPFFASASFADAEAARQGFYISVTGGNTDGATIDTQSSVVSAGSSGSAYFGYQLNPNIAFQGGYTLLIYNSDVSQKNVVVGSTTISGLEFNALFSRPITDWMFPYLLVGKAVMSETDTLISGGTQPAVSFAGYTYGAGVRFNINANWGVQLGYTIYSLSDYYGFSISLPKTSLGFRYKF